MEKRPFSGAAMGGWGKYHAGSYYRIGVYRVKPDDDRVVHDGVHGTHQFRDTVF